MREVRLAGKAAELLILVASKIHFGVFSGDFSSFGKLYYQSEILYNASCKRAFEIENYVTKLVNPIVLITDC